MSGRCIPSASVSKFELYLKIKGKVMAQSGDQVVDLKVLATEHMNGNRGFANTKKLKKLGIDGYRQWLEGELAKKAAIKASKSAS